MIYQGDKMINVKRSNRSAAMHLLHEHGSMSRKCLAADMNLTPAAISKIVGELIAEGLLIEGSTVPGDGVGRREIMVKLNAHARCALGILINLRQAILSAVWMDGSLIFSEELTLEPFAPTEATVKALSARIRELSVEHQIPQESVLGLGVAIRGITSPDARTIQNSFGALDTENFSLCSCFEKELGITVTMSNNVRALFSAQMFLSKDKNLTSQFFLRCEYGIGASLAINSKIWCGSTEQCAEIGHIPIIKRGGKPCSCGKCGCLETIASPTAIRESALAILSPDKTPVLWNMSREKKVEEITLNNILESARYGDKGTAEIVDHAIEALAGALKSVIYILDPGKIVLYGKAFENAYYLSRLTAEMKEGVDSSHDVIIEKSQYNGLLENRAAGLLVIEDFFDKGGIL